MFQFPPCTASRVTASRVILSQSEYDRLRECEEELRSLKRGRKQTTAEWLRETFLPDLEPIANPAPREPVRVVDGVRVEVRGPVPIDAATGQPWQPGRRPLQAQEPEWLRRLGEPAPVITPAVVGDRVTWFVVEET